MNVSQLRSELKKVRFKLICECTLLERIELKIAEKKLERQIDRKVNNNLRTLIGD